MALQLYIYIIRYLSDIHTYPCQRKHPHTRVQMLAKLVCKKAIYVTINVHIVEFATIIWNSRFRCSEVDIDCMVDSLYRFNLQVLHQFDQLSNSDLPMQAWKHK